MSLKNPYDKNQVLNEKVMQYREKCQETVLAQLFKVLSWFK